MNRYQERKAQKIAQSLEEARGRSTLSRKELVSVARLLSEEQWRTVAFGAKCSVADTQVRERVVSILSGKQARSIR